MISRISTKNCIELNGSTSTNTLNISESEIIRIIQDTSRLWLYIDCNPKLGRGTKIEFSSVYTSEFSGRDLQAHTNRSHLLIVFSNISCVAA